MSFRGSSCVCCVVLLLTPWFATRLLAQGFTYTHTGPTDGFSWPTSLEETFYFETPDGIEYDNYSGNDTFFDSGYSAVGASGVIDGDAWWGNPASFGSVDFYFYNTPEGAVDSFAFDFAWATMDDFVPSTLYVQAEDSTTGYSEFEYPLNDFFSFEDYEGAAGRVSLMPSDFEYEVDDGVFEPLEDFTYLYISLGEIGTEDLSSEFAIDNVTVNESGGTPDESDLNAPLSIGTRYLRGSFSPQIDVHVSNDGVGGTTFTQSLDPNSDAAFQAFPPVSGVPIGPGQQEVSPPGPVGILDKDEPSGEYVAQIRTTNDLNPSDPDIVTPFTVRMYDPPELTDNSGAPIDVVSSAALSIENAAAGPHAGALRAGAEVTASGVTGDGFSVVGMAVGDFVEPGEVETADAAFSRYGRLTGLHTGGFTAELKMNSAAGSFLNGSQPVDSVAWDLEYELADTLNDSASVAASGELAEAVGVNTSLSAATLVDGQSSNSQTVTMDVAGSSPIGQTTTALLATDVVDIGFSVPGDPFVLQFTYTDEGIPASLDESDLELVSFNTATDDWELAVASNSDGGAGAAMFSGSYVDYLGTLGGGAPALGAYGVDTLNNHAWAVLDHASVFAAGSVIVGPPIPGDFNRDGVVDAADYTVWRDDLEGEYTPADYQMWSDNYGRTAGFGEANAVPEPTGVFSVLAAASVVVTLRRGRSTTTFN